MLGKSVPVWKYSLASLAEYVILEELNCISTVLGCLEVNSEYDMNAIWNRYWFEECIWCN